MSYCLEKVDSKWIVIIKDNLLDANIDMHLKSRLFNMLSIEFTDEELRVWASSEIIDISDLGWRALARRRGLNILGDILESLPSSFANNHKIPTLRALAEINELPESITSTLMGKISSPMQPMATESFILAMSHIKPNGILNILSWIRNQPYIFGSYHFECFLKVFNKWSKETGIKIMADFNHHKLNIIDYLLFLQLTNPNTDEPAEWIRITLEYSENTFMLDQVALSITHNINSHEELGRVKVNKYNERICNVLVSKFGLISAYQVYKDYLNKLPNELIIKIFLEISDKEIKELNSFLYHLSKQPKKSDLLYYRKIIDTSLELKIINKENLRYYCDILSTLDEEDFLSILTPHIPKHKNDVINMIRLIEDRIVLWFNSIGHF